MRCLDEENTEEVELLGQGCLVVFFVCLVSFLVFSVVCCCDGVLFVFNILLLDGSLLQLP